MPRGDLHATERTCIQCYNYTVLGRRLLDLADGHAVKLEFAFLLTVL